MGKKIFKIIALFSISMSFTHAEVIENKLLTEEESIEIVKKEALNEMLDPDSTNFKILFIKPMSVKEKIDEYGNEYFPAIVCGEYNSKNRMGGYNGYQRFYATQNYKESTLNTSIKFEEHYKDDKYIFDGFYNVLCQ